MLCNLYCYFLVSLNNKNFMNLIKKFQGLVHTILNSSKLNLKLFISQNKIESIVLMTIPDKEDTKKNN